MRVYFYAFLMYFAFAASEFAGVAAIVPPQDAQVSTGAADISVASPSPGQSVSSPFTLAVDARSCKGQSVKTLGYSFDHGSTTVFKGQSSMNVKASIWPGAHTLKIKAWTNIRGDVCVVQVPINVTAAAGGVVADSSVVPSNASTVGQIQALANWKTTHDTAVSGSSSGTTSLVASPSRSGLSRKFVTTYENYGAQRYSVVFGNDQTVTNFFYDTWIYIESPSDGIGNLEFDVDQTMPNGATVNFGVQCDGWTGTWAYSENRGTPSHPRPHWAKSQAPCNPRKWSTGEWHHLQALYSRNDVGDTTYQWVALDGRRQRIDATVSNARRLGWAPVITTQFQVDGSTAASGNATVYLDDLTVSRW